ncbi:MAG: GGDEF domain-containing protein [Planctomycetes bacterium]|nr:GGDEF domain-containing protein [Planctomycetota bacterium]
MGDERLPEYFSEFASIGVESTLAAGVVLWKEGDPSDQVVLLLQGNLEVTHATESGDVIVLRILEPGAVVGELASLDGRARSATVRARTECRLLRVPAAEFRATFRRRPEILESLFCLQVERVRSLTERVTRVHDRAIVDSLTRLYNFGFFKERLRLELERADHTGDHVSLVIFDIDHFKHYNDVNGHEEGNVALVKVASLVKGAGRRGDIIARYGGEEFVGLLYGASSEDAVHFAEAVRKKVEAAEFAGGKTQPLGRVSVSGGVASFPEDASGEKELIEAADRNLYRAKSGGRNRIVPAPEGQAPA